MVSANLTKVLLLTMQSRTSQSSFLILLLASVVLLLLSNPRYKPGSLPKAGNLKQKEERNYFVDAFKLRNPKVPCVSDFLKFQFQYVGRSLGSNDRKQTKGPKKQFT